MRDEKRKQTLNIQHSTFNVQRSMAEGKRRRWTVNCGLRSSECGLRDEAENAAGPGLLIFQIGISNFQSLIRRVYRTRYAYRSMPRKSYRHGVRRLRGIVR